MRADGLKRRKQITLVGGLDRQYRTPGLDDPLDSFDRNSSFADSDIAELSQALEQQYAVCRPHRSR
jgi:hypothetical protein